MAKKKSTTKKHFKDAQEMDAFLEQADLSIEFDKLGKVIRPTFKKINLDLPEWLLEQLDIEAARAGVSRQPLIKIWLVQKLEEERLKRASKNS
ncbi:MAG: CopG family transcriptional regulator [Halobacteriovorax sp.]|nr:CopG family transcriptional regulator [Halobacteriovorax sp.]